MPSSSAMQAPTMPFYAAPMQPHIQLPTPYQFVPPTPSVHIGFGGLTVGFNQLPQPILQPYQHPIQPQLQPYQHPVQPQLQPYQHPVQPQLQPYQYPTQQPMLLQAHEQSDTDSSSSDSNTENYDEESSDSKDSGQYVF